MNFKEFIRGIGKDWKSYIIIALGCFISAIAFVVFLVPNKIVPGGVGGISIVLHHQFGFPVGVTMLVINAPLFLAGFRYLGGFFGVKTSYATILLAVFIDGISGLPVLTHNLLLAAVFGGIIAGVGLGLAISCNSTTGGTDLLAFLVHRHFPAFSIGRILLVIDGLVVTAAALTFRNYELALYATIAIYLTAKLINEILEGADHAKGVYIISHQKKEIAKRLMNRNRGVTAIYSRGMWTDERKDMLLCIIRNREIPMVKRVIREVDPDAFVFVSQVSEVLGEGFKPH